MAVVTMLMAGQADTKLLYSLALIWGASHDLPVSLFFSLKMAGTGFCAQQPHSLDTELLLLSTNSTNLLRLPPQERM